jgi:hypothetical protein
MADGVQAHQRWQIGAACIQIAQLKPCMAPGLQVARSAYQVAQVG